jgi:hypothetical protein
MKIPETVAQRKTVLALRRAKVSALDGEEGVGVAAM